MRQQRFYRSRNSETFNANCSHIVSFMLINSVVDSTCSLPVAASSSVELMRNLRPSMLSTLALKMQYEFSRIGLLL